MKVVHVSQSEPRDACLAKLCAEVYGQQAGLTPLVVFTGTKNVLFAQEGARLLAYRAARMSEHGVDHRAETSMAKFAAAEALIEAASTANRVLGGYACNLDTPAERYLRDAFTWVSAHGTIEIQKMTVSRSIFSGR